MNPYSQNTTGWDWQTTSSKHSKLSNNMHRTTDWEENQCITNLQKLDRNTKRQTGKFETLGDNLEEKSEIDVSKVVIKLSYRALSTAEQTVLARLGNFTFTHKEQILANIESSIRTPPEQ